MSDCPPWPRARPTRTLDMGWLLEDHIHFDRALDSVPDGPIRSECYGLDGGSVTTRVWFRADLGVADLRARGFRAGGGGTHQAMTMMLRELTQLLAADAVDDARLASLIIDENILGKSTAAAKASAFRHIRNLYGLGTPSVAADALVSLWSLDAGSRPLLALLCALARDPLLRVSADVVLDAQVGARVKSGPRSCHRRRVRACGDMPR